MGTILSLINNNIVRYILIALSFASIGFVGGCQYQKNKMATDIVKLQQKQAIETKSLQIKVDTITNDFYQQNLKNQSKYESLQNDYKIISDNLNKCRLNNKQLQLFIDSANQSVRTSSDNGKQYITSTDAGQFANFTCQDLGATLIAHDKMYFEAKDKLDALQKIMRDILKANK